MFIPESFNAILSEAEKSRRKDSLIVRAETKEDWRAVENLIRESFWNVYRPGCMEHYVMHCFRSDPAFVPELDLVLEKDGQLIGQVMYVRAELDLDNGKKLPIMVLGPICIAPEYKRQGYGRYLLDVSLEKAKAMNAGGIVIEGNIDFYGKSGFVVAKTKGIRYADDPDAEYLLCRELTERYFDDVKGVFRDPEGYFVCQNNPEAFDAYEATFPPKKKLKLPGQLFEA